MKLCCDDPDLRLSLFIDSIKHASYSWRMISLELQDSEALHSKLFQDLCYQNLADCFKKFDGEIFWFRPNFVLIFFQGRLLPIEKTVESFLKTLEFHGQGKFFDILDLSIHWNELINLAEHIVPKYKSIISAPVGIDFVSAPLPSRSVPQVSFDGVPFDVNLDPSKLAQISVPRSQRKRPVIMLVEDDSFTRQLITLALGSYEVICAETTRQALVFYKRHAPDMTFLDINLPDGNGINLLKQISDMDPKSYSVMISSSSKKEHIMEASSLGAKGFIGKPFKRQRLIDTVNNFSQIWQAEREPV
jgi:two-component system chemotaxis response regulator CheY